MNTRRTTDRRARDRSLAALARDLADGTPPAWFPSTLVLRERGYQAALDAGEPDALANARAAFIDALESSLERDRERLALLGAGPGSFADGQFLRGRARVMQARLDQLEATPSPAIAVPSAPAEHTPTSPAVPDTPPPAAPALLTQPSPRPAPQAPEPELRHRDDIQGLRAVAVLLVALGHAGVGFLAGGFIGVDVFFVLSGFLITGLLLAEARRRRFVSLGDFYLRRARRILPAATLTLIATDVAVYSLLNFVRAKQYISDSIPSAVFGANIHFASQGVDYFARGQLPSPLQHFWSLAVEEQFYLVWPLVFALVLGLSLRRFGSRPVSISERLIRRVLIAVAAIGLASLAWSVRDTATHPAGAYFSTLARAWELGLGAALAIAASHLANLPARWRTPMGWVGLACIALAAVTFSANTPFPGSAALLPTLGAGLLIAAGISKAQGRLSAGAILSLAPLRYVGDRSYAFYLWHWPFLIIASAYAGHNLSVGTNLLLLAAAFAVSVVSYRLVEKPVRSAEWTRRTSALLPLTAPTLVVLVLATFFITSIQNREDQQINAAASTAIPVLTIAAPTPVANATPQGAGAAAGQEGGLVLPAVIAAVNGTGPRGNGVLHPAVAQLLSDFSRFPSACEAHDGESTSQLCHFGDPSGRKLVLLGDSHADMWMPDVLSLASREHWDLIPITKSGCSPIYWTAAANTSDCNAWFHWAIHQIRALRPDVAMISGDYSYLGPGSTQALDDAFNGAITAIRSATHRVVVVGDVPERSKQPVDCLLANSSGGCFEPLSSNQSDLTTSVSGLAAADGAGFVDPTGWFCYASQCPLVVADIITYRDNNHVSKTYANALTAAFRQEFDAAAGIGHA